MMCVFWEAIKESSTGWTKKHKANCIGLWQVGAEFWISPLTRAGFLTRAALSDMTGDSNACLVTLLRNLKEAMEENCPSHCWACKDAVPTSLSFWVSLFRVRRSVSRMRGSTGGQNGSLCGTSLKREVFKGQGGVFRGEDEKHCYFILTLQCNATVESAAEIFSVYVSRDYQRCGNELQAHYLRKEEGCEVCFSVVLS